METWALQWVSVNTTTELKEVSDIYMESLKSLTLIPTSFMHRTHAFR